TAVAKSVTTSAVHSSSSASSSRRFVTTLVTSFVSRRRSVGAALDLSSLSVVPSAMPDGLVTRSRQVSFYSTEPGGKPLRRHTRPNLVDPEQRQLERVTSWLQHLDQL